MLKLLFFVPLVWLLACGSAPPQCEVQIEPATEEFPNLPNSTAFGAGATALPEPASGTGAGTTSESVTESQAKPGCENGGSQTTSATQALNMDGTPAIISEFDGLTSP